MKLYEYNIAIEYCVDLETGEKLDEAAVEALQMERDEKIESLCLWMKNLNAEAKAIKEEKDKLAQRQKTLENKAESIKNYITSVLEGQKFETPRVKVSYRKSSSVDVFDEKKLYENHPELFKVSNPVPDKTAIKDAITNDAFLEGAKIVEKLSTIIK